MLTIKVVESEIVFAMKIFQIYMQVYLGIVVYIRGSIFVGSHIFFVKYFSVCKDLYTGVVYGKCVHMHTFLVEVAYTN